MITVKGRTMKRKGKMDDAVMLLKERIEACELDKRQRISWVRCAVDNQKRYGKQIVELNTEIEIYKKAIRKLRD